MMDIGLAVTIVSAIAGGTWVLRSKLSDIEAKLDGVVGRVTVLEKRAQIIKIEGRSKRR